MDGLSNLLAPFSGFIGISANLLTLANLVAPSTFIFEIRKRRTTKNEPIFPYLASFILCVLYAVHGKITNDFVSIVVDSIGALLYFSYTYQFYIFSPPEHKTQFRSHFKSAGIFIASMITMIMYGGGKLSPSRLEVILGCFLDLLIGMPLLNFKTIVRNKRSGFSKFHCKLGSCVYFAWTMNGVALRNNFAIVQNFIAFLFYLTQLALVSVYPAKRNTIKAHKKD